MSENFSADELGELAIRVLAMPADTNPNGDIFGGWVVSQMDLAGLSVAARRAQSRITTAAIDQIHFIAPVKVGDFICCYVKLLKVGRTSMRVQVTTCALNPVDGVRRKVTQGEFTYVAINLEGRPQPVDR